MFSVPIRDVRVPTRLQFQTTECGVAALAMILAYHGRHISNEELRSATGVSRDCVNAAAMAQTARQYGLVCKAFRREPEELEDLPRPFLVHLRFIHFVVVEGFSRTHVLVNDPATGRGRIVREKFHEDFTGVVLSFSVSSEVPSSSTTEGTKNAEEPDFRTQSAERRTEERSLSSFLHAAFVVLRSAFVHAKFRQPGRSGPWLAFWRRLDPSVKRRLGAASVTGAAAAALLPMFALTHGEWADFSVSLPVAIALLYAVLLTTQQAILSRVRDAIAAKQTRMLSERIVSMPASFFAYRLPARLHAILYGNDAIARLLCSELAPGLIALVSVPASLLLLASIDPAAAWVVTTLSACWLASIALVFRWRGEAIRISHEGVDLPAIAFDRDELLASKLGTKDDDFTTSRLGAIAAQQQLVQESGEIGALLRAIHASCFVAATASVLLLIRSHRPDPATGVAIALLTVAAVAPLRRLDTLFAAWDALSHALLPVDDLLETPRGGQAGGGKEDVAVPRSPLKSETALPPDTRHQPPQSAPLPRDVVLCASQVTFGYSAKREPLLRDVSLSLSRGEQLGVTGPSGSGKSTFASLLAGDGDPWAGRVEYGEGATAIVLVDKSSFLFEGSIRENLALWRTVPDGVMQRAIVDACVDGVIGARPGGLEAPVLHGGTNFSGGERQRLEIARALLSDPQIVILDEAMDGLDPALESQIRANLRARGCSLIVVTHRSSSLAACDRVVTLVAGRMVRGDENEDHAQASVPYVIAPPRETAPRGDAKLRAAVRRIASLLGAPSSTRSEDSDTSIASIARLHGLRVRPIRFMVRDWWRRNHGPMLAFRRDSGDPVVIIRKGRQQIATEPESGRPLDLSVPDDLEIEAYRFYANAPARLGMKGDHAKDAGSAIALSLLVAGCFMVVPALALGSFRHHQGWSQAAGIVALAAATGLLELGRVALLVRAFGAIELPVMAAGIDRVARLSTAFVNRTDTDLLSRSLLALQSLFARGRAVPADALLHASLTASGLAVLFAVSSQHGVLAMLLAAAGIAGCVLLSHSARAIERPYDRARRMSSRFLFDVLCGFSRLRLLRSADVALERWQAKYAGDLRRGSAVRTLDARLTVVRQLAPWLLLSIFSTFFAAQQRPAILPAIAIVFWITIDASFGLASSAVAALRTRMLREDAGVIAAAPLDPPASLPTRPAVLELRDASYRYPGTGSDALHGIALRVEPGELLAITGPSGGGKSTLVRLIAGTHDVDGGETLLDGVAPTEGDRVSWRRGVGLVSQDEPIHFSTTLRRLIGGPILTRVDDLWRAAHAALVAEDIARMPMGLQTIAESSNLSAGERQRIQIARELLRRPRVLILDEATSAISDDVQARLFENLRGMGMTCIVVTHRQSAIHAMDRVIVMREGSIVSDGAPAVMQRADAGHMKEHA